MSVETPTGTTHLRVVLIGQPNSGKSSLFNRLTGLRQRVGNYPGVTVERKEGICRMGGTVLNLVDLPGIYSLKALSADEQISVRGLIGHPQVGPPPDVVVCVVDASRLQRSLLPVYQAADLGRPMVLALNFYDEAQAAGWRFDLSMLERRLGVPVIPTVGHRGIGVEALRTAILHAHEHPRSLTPIPWPAAVLQARQSIENGLDKITDPGVRRLTAHRLLFDGASSALDELTHTPDEVRRTIGQCQQQLHSLEIHPSTAELTLLFPVIEAALQGAVHRTHAAPSGLTPRLDALLTHPVGGLAVFLLVMWGIFLSVYSGAAPLMDAIESATAGLQDAVGSRLESLPLLQSLITDGVLAGVGSVVVFLPQILILTLFISFLEDCGYLARAAFLIDRSLSWCGLSGKSFVPLMSGYACAIPAILATRTIEEHRSRLTTMLVTPFMSCSARLPVYVLMIGAFIEPRYGAGVAATTLLAMHLLGPVVALPLLKLAQHTVLRTPAPPFILELPPYRWPTVRDLSWRLWLRTRRFLTDAGTIILAMSVIIWALLTFPRPSNLEERERAAWPIPADTSTEENEAEFQNHMNSVWLENSYLGRAGKWIQPVFEPAGFDWKITLAVLASFPAREVVLSTLGIIYQLGDQDDENSSGLRARMQAERWPDGPRAGQPVFTIPTAAAVMVFFALCLQCGATVALLAAESSWRLAWGSFAFMSVLAWIGAVVTYQSLTALGL